MVVEGGSTCSLSWKKAIAINSVAIHIRIKPMKSIDRIAPINNRIPAVPNKPTFAFTETFFSERQMKNPVITRNIQKSTYISIIGVSRGTSNDTFRLSGEICGVVGSVVQSPFQVG